MLSFKSWSVLLHSKGCKLSYYLVSFYPAHTHTRGTTHIYTAIPCCSSCSHPCCSSGPLRAILTWSGLTLTELCNNAIKVYDHTWSNWLLAHTHRLCYSPNTRQTVCKSYLHVSLCLSVFPVFVHCGELHIWMDSFHKFTIQFDFLFSKIWYKLISYFY